MRLSGPGWPQAPARVRHIRMRTSAVPMAMPTRHGGKVLRNVLLDDVRLMGAWGGMDVTRTGAGQSDVLQRRQSGANS